MKRARSSRVDRWLAIATAILLGGGSPVAPATITVSGSCTLSRAIDAANDDDDAGGLCPRVRSPGGPDILILTGDVTLRTVEDHVYGSDTGLPLVTSDVTIVGRGYAVERDPSAPPFRIFAVATSGTLTLDDVAVRGGKSEGRGGGIVSYGTLNVVGSSIQNNESTRLGGGISNAGILTMTDSTVSGNAGGLGAIFCVYETQALRVDHCIVADNHGTGLQSSASANAPSEITNSSFLRNDGHGASLTYTTTHFSNVTFEDNADRGVHVGYGSRVFVNSSTIHRNAGGGVRVDEWSQLLLTNSTISGNVTASQGAAILDLGGGRVTSSTIVGNTSTAANGAGIYGVYTYHHTGLSFRDSIVAGNEPRDCGSDVPGLVGCDTLPSLTPGIDVAMELADNGGPTRTHALPPGSAAIDAGVECEVEADQRGVPRDGACDLGAYEFVAPIACEACSQGRLLVGRIEDLRNDHGCARADCVTLPPGMSPVEYLLTLPADAPGEGYFYLE